ncbi:hypothetical protein KR100_01345 [Synechococcus sp. KORDI-100]|nr:hypothetical protein KR100_01345 [Synechococcus sp. KORDI-100]
MMRCLVVAEQLLVMLIPVIKFKFLLLRRVRLHVCKSVIEFK